MADHREVLHDVFENEESSEDLWCQEVLGLYPDLEEGGGGPEAQRADQDKPV